MVDRGGGPYRVLYVCGRPNWEFKFLRRALAEDDQLELVGLVRIARREPKFSFRSRAGESTNPLFRGFEHPDEEAAERYDQPVLVRLGTKDENELRDGFPKTADELVPLRRGDSRRCGSGVLHAGPAHAAAEFCQPARRRAADAGRARFVCGRSLRPHAGRQSAAGVRRARAAKTSPGEHEYRLALTREGWLQPWVRTRQTEPEERERLAAMPAFRALSHVGSIKPAATVLAEVVDEAGAKHPALVTQRFGRGRSAALLIGDFWRWGLRRRSDKESDLEKSWRQTVRWLVADVPRRVEVDVRPQDESEIGARGCASSSSRRRILAAGQCPSGDRSYDAGRQEARARGRAVRRRSGRIPGDARAAAAGRLSGAVKVKRPTAARSASARRAGSRSRRPTSSIACGPIARWLEEIAAKTGGEVVASDDLDDFVASLPTRKAPITEPWIRPAWHHPLFYLAIIGCLWASGACGAGRAWRENMSAD